MEQNGFLNSNLDTDTLNELKSLSLKCKADILAMTTLASSGHPGGSMSSIDMYLTLFKFANLFTDNPHNQDRDRIIVSHGHTSPGVYSALARNGFFNIDDSISGFRRAGSIFEGHVERTVPGVEWGTGNLGQGLSVGCGVAMAAKINKKNYNTFVVMGDGEQQKGQISEAREFAAKNNLFNLTVLIDNNHLQISGNIKDIMPQNIKENFISDGWNVIEINGHDFNQIYESIYAAINDKSAPTAIIADTIMGKGVSFMENIAKFHGAPLNEEDFYKAVKELSVDFDLEKYKKMREEEISLESHQPPPEIIPDIIIGEPIIYGKDDKTDNRSAFGNALKSIAQVNKERTDNPKIAVLDCDLASSVKTNGFQSVLPDNLIETGIQEHSAATIAGAISIEGILTFFADFGVFGVCETYNQHRLNDINHANLKLACTHIGLDVGEDGKTHQCIDYMGLFQNLFGFGVIIPGDPNQTDRATRYISETYGNFLLGMGRSKLPTILDESGNPFYGQDYKFEYGKIDRVRDGDDATIISCGSVFNHAIKAHDILREKGIKVKVLNLSCPKKLDDAALLNACKTGIIVTCEDHNSATGIGSRVANWLVDKKQSVTLRKLGVTSYGFSGPTDKLFKAAGIDPDSIVEAVKAETDKK